MKLEKEIERVRSWADMQEKMANIYSESGEEDRARRYMESAEENRCIANWLYELTLYRLHGTVARINGKLYVADDPKLKTVHGKTGEVVIGGFKEVEG